jgi:hypothetical protein
MRSQPALTKLDSQGNIPINITVHPKELTLLHKIGEGSFSVVFKGRLNDQPVAIKLLREPTQKNIKVLCREAEIMFKLGGESKYIVPLKKICLKAPHYLLVMELMPQGSLYDLLHNEQPLPWSIRFQIALDVVWGLKALHSYGILHLDLKSLNILLDDRLRAKLGDFGSARIREEVKNQSIIASTPRWMAPEHFDNKAEITTAADIYSYGIVLWELSSRKIPFEDKENEEVMRLIMSGGSESREKIPVDCPTPLASIIESCWQQKPKKRPTAKALMKKLNPLLHIQKPELKTTPAIPTKQKLLQLNKDKKHRPAPQAITPISTPQILQNLLIAACKRGDEEKVKVLLNLGAKAHIANLKGEKPLGAGVWGMCPGVVNALLNKMDMDYVAPMTWKQCEKHNQKHYQKIFIVPKFAPKTYQQWYHFLNTMEHNSFIRDNHLREANECAYYLSYNSPSHSNSQNQYVMANWSWGSLKQYVGISAKPETIKHKDIMVAIVLTTEKDYIEFRTRIKQIIKEAMPMLSDDFDKDSSMESKSQSPLQTPKPILPASQNRQTFIPAPKTVVHGKQLQQKNQLMAATLPAKNV